eukprot:m.104995 g.104995  ORF g.104995 m.104995 type:complete len:140 (-) comp12646_c1_seq15:2545-2964(-)
MMRTMLFGRCVGAARAFTVRSEMHPGLLFANNGDVNGRECFPVVNPSTQNVIGFVPNCSVDDAINIIDRAHEAQTKWKNTTARERNALLSKWAELILENAEYLGKIITLEQGKPIKEGIGEISYVVYFVLCKRSDENER